MRKRFVTRYEGNPILTTEDIPYQVETVHNAGVTKHNGRYIMLFRSHLDTGRSIIGLAESARRIPLHAPPGALPDARHRNRPSREYEEYGVEDPRITLARRRVLHHLQRLLPSRRADRPGPDAAISSPSSESRSSRRPTTATRSCSRKESPAATSAWTGRTRRSARGRSGSPTRRTSSTGATRRS